MRWGVTVAGIALTAVATAAACAKPKKKGDDVSAPTPTTTPTPAPAPTPGPAAQLPLPAPGPGGPALPALPLPFVAELGLAKVFSLEAPSSVQGLGVAPETPEDEGMMLADALRSREACVARQLAGKPMADLRVLARRLCLLEAVAERLERGKRYASIGPIGIGAYVEEGAATIHVCLDDKPYAKVSVESGTHGRVKGTLKVAAAPRAIEGRFDNGVGEEGRTVFELAVADGAARQKARLSLASAGVSDLAYSATAPTPVRLAARIDGTKGAALLRYYAADLATGQEANAVFDAAGLLVDAVVVPVGASSLLPIPAGAAAPAFGESDWSCDGETLDFSTTTQELTAIEACDAATAPFVPAESCETAAFEPVPRSAFTCDPVAPEGC